MFSTFAAAFTVVEQLAVADGEVRAALAGRLQPLQQLLRRHNARANKEECDDDEVQVGSVLWAEAAF